MLYDLMHRFFCRKTALFGEKAVLKTENATLVNRLKSRGR